MNHSFSIIIIILSILLSACSTESPKPEETPQESETIGNDVDVVCINNYDDAWDHIIYSNRSRMSFVKETSDGLNAIGIYGEDTLALKTDKDLRPVQIMAHNFTLHFRYDNNDIHIYGVANKVLFTDSISIDNTTTPSRAIDDYIFTIAEWALNSVIQDTLKKFLPTAPFIALVQFLHDIDDMTTMQQLNYIVDKLENWQGVVLDFLYNIPFEWWKKLMDNIKIKNELYNTSSTIVAGLITGDANNITPTSASCSVNGILEAYAISSELNFSYGICYGTSSTPTIDDNKASKDIVVLKDYIMKFSLPEEFKLKNLTSATSYYYRCFFIDNSTKEVYYGDTKSFTTPHNNIKIENLRQIESNASYIGFASQNDRYQYKFTISFDIERDNSVEYKSWGYYYFDERNNKKQIELPLSSVNKNIEIDTYSKYNEHIFRCGWFYELPDGTLLTGDEQRCNCTCSLKPDIKYHIKINSHQDFNYTPTSISIDTIINVYPNAEDRSFNSLVKNFTINANKSNWMVHNIYLRYSESDSYKAAFINNYKFAIDNLFLSYTVDSSMWSTSYYFNISNQMNVTNYYKSDPDLYISNNKRIEGHKSENFSLDCSVQYIDEK